MKVIVFILSLMLAQTAIALPEINTWKTSTDIQVMHVEATQLPMIDVAITFDAGTARDGQKAGLSKLTHALLNKGAGTLNADAIASGFEDVGAQFSSNVDMDRSSVLLRSLSEPKLFSKALDLYIKVMAQPSFPGKDFQRERKRMLIGLEDKQQTPSAIVSDNFYQALYGSHPFAQSGDGTIQSIERITRDDIKNFHASHMVSTGAVLAIVGDIDQTAARELAEHISEALPQGQAHPPIPTVMENQQQVIKVDFPSQQSHVRMGQVGIQRSDPDYFTLYVGNHVLGGGGFTSRLVEEVRSKRGLSYSVYSYFMPLLRQGPFMLGLQTRADQVDEALTVCRDEIDKFIQYGPTQEELTLSKQSIINGFPLRIDSNRDILGYLSVIGYYDLPLTYLNDFRQQIAKVTLADIKSAFKRRLNPKSFVTVVVGSAQQE